MSRTINVLRKKNKIDREIKLRKQKQIAQIRKNSAFKAVALKLFSDIDGILDADKVESVSIKIKEDDLEAFGRLLIESSEMDNYEIAQKNGEKTVFIIRKRYINI